jgi:hypothetical protein
VYVANSVARFRTERGIGATSPTGSADSPSATDHVRFKLGPNVPTIDEASYFASMGWSFATGK